MVFRRERGVAVRPDWPDEIDTTAALPSVSTVCEAVVHCLVAVPGAAMMQSQLLPCPAALRSFDGRRFIAATFVLQPAWLIATDCVLLP